MGNFSSDMGHQGAFSVTEQRGYYCAWGNQNI